MRHHTRRLRMPALVLAAVCAALLALGYREVLPVLAVGLATTVAFVTLREYAIGTRGLRGRGVSWAGVPAALLARDPRRYGGYLVHLGVAVMAVAVVGSMVYAEQTRATVSPGESFEASGYTFRFEDLYAREPGVNGIELEGIARLVAERDGEQVAVLEPGRRFFSNFPDQPVAIVAVDSNLMRDLYVFVQGWDTERRAEVQVFVNPLVQWLWIGGGLYALGGLLAFGVARRPVPVPAAQPVVEAEPA